jgi:hypothetical protein
LFVGGLLGVAGYLQPYFGEGYVDFVEVCPLNVKPTLPFGKNNIVPDA